MRVWVYIWAYLLAYCSLAVSTRLRTFFCILHQSYLGMILNAGVYSQNLVIRLHYFYSSIWYLPILSEITWPYYKGRWNGAKNWKFPNSKSGSGIYHWFLMRTAAPSPILMQKYCLRRNCYFFIEFIEPKRWSKTQIIVWVDITINYRATWVQTPPAPKQCPFSDQMISDKAGKKIFLENIIRHL
jgi:hypothetical protein